MQQQTSGLKMKQLGPREPANRFADPSTNKPVNLNQKAIQCFGTQQDRFEQHNKVLSKNKNPGPGSYSGTLGFAPSKRDFNQRFSPSANRLSGDH